MSEITKSPLSRTLILSLTCLSALCTALPAHAQFAGTTSREPVDVVADEIQSQGNTTTLTGQADVRQGDVRVLADQIKIFGTGANSDVSGVSRVIATGNFYYITPEQEVRGTEGVYEKSTDTFTVKGDVILLQGEDNIVTGDTLFYNVTDKSARIVGTCKGRKCGSNGRVKALLKSTNTTQNAS